MVGSNVNLPEEENTPEKRVERIFNLMDKVSFNLNYSFFMKPATRSDFPLPFATLISLNTLHFRVFTLKFEKLIVNILLLKYALI